MTSGERELMDRARDVIAARISAEHPNWVAGHDLQGWYAERLEDGYVVRASGPNGLRAFIGVAPPCTACQAVGELRREFRGWHIWSDASGCWHARRRGNFRQEHRPGAPLYAVHAVDLATLRRRLAQQDPPGGQQEPAVG